MNSFLRRYYVALVVGVVGFGLLAQELGAMEQPQVAQALFRERIVRLSDAARANTCNGEKQLKNVILHFNAIGKLEAQEALLRDFPALQQRLNVLHISLADFYCELMNDVAESMEDTLKFKRAHAVDGDLKDHEFYEQLTSLMGRMGDPTLYWCECKNAPVEVRLRFVCSVLNHILLQCPNMSAPVSYTDDGEEGCLQTYLVAHGLALLGCPHVSINVINRPPVIGLKAVPAKIESVRAKLALRYPMHIDSNIFDCAHISQAAAAIRLQPGIHVFAAVDIIQEVDGWYVEQYKQLRQVAPVVPPINAISFCLMFDGQMRKYEVTVNFRRHGISKVSFEPGYPELMVRAPQLMLGDYKNISKVVMCRLAATPFDEIVHRLCDGQRPELVFEQDFKEHLIKRIPRVAGFAYTVKHDSSICLLDDIVDLVMRGSPDGHSQIFLLDGACVLKLHVVDGLLKGDTDGKTY